MYMHTNSQVYQRMFSHAQAVNPRPLSFPHMASEWGEYAAPQDATIRSYIYSSDIFANFEVNKIAIFFWVQYYWLRLNSLPVMTKKWLKFSE